MLISNIILSSKEKLVCFSKQTNFWKTKSEKQTNFWVVHPFCSLETGLGTTN